MSESDIELIVDVAAPASRCRTQESPFLFETWQYRGVTRPITILAWCLGALVALVPVAAAHGDGAEEYRTTILSVEPPGLPVDVRIDDGDRVRFENAGDEPLVLCGYEDEHGCEEWVRISRAGVEVDHNARSYFANVDEEEYGAIPDDAGTEPDWKLVREGPPFYAYHDHRAHWMGLSLPPNVDPSDPARQPVFESELAFRYGDTDGVVRTRLDYVGGRTLLQRYGEQALVAGGVAAMLVVFVVDARRRRRRAAAAGTAGAPVDDASESAAAVTDEPESAPHVDRP